MRKKKFTITNWDGSPLRHQYPKTHSSQILFTTLNYEPLGVCRLISCATLWACDKQPILEIKSCHCSSRFKCLGWQLPEITADLQLWRLMKWRLRVSTASCIFHQGLFSYYNSCCNVLLNVSLAFSDQSQVGLLCRDWFVVSILKNCFGVDSSPIGRICDV